MSACSYWRLSVKTVVSPLSAVMRLSVASDGLRWSFADRTFGQLINDLGRHAADEGVGRHVAGHHRACPDDRAATDSDSGQNRRASHDDGALLDLDGHAE